MPRLIGMPRAGKQTGGENGRGGSGAFGPFDCGERCPHGILCSRRMAILGQCCAGLSAGDAADPLVLKMPVPLGYKFVIASRSRLTLSLLLPDCFCGG
jgi:hypothetical protein